MYDKEIRREVFRTQNFEKLNYIEILPLIENLEKLKYRLNKVDTKTNDKIQANNIKVTCTCKYDERCKELVEINPKTGKEHPLCKKHYQKYLEKIKNKNDGAKINNIKMNPAKVN